MGNIDDKKEKDVQKKLSIKDQYIEAKRQIAEIKKSGEEYRLNISECVEKYSEMLNVRAIEYDEYLNGKAEQRKADLAEILESIKSSANRSMDNSN